jgi:hypothetical protein
VTRNNIDFASGYLCDRRGRHGACMYVHKYRDDDGTAEELEGKITGTFAHLAGDLLGPRRRSVALL